MTPSLPVDPAKLPRDWRSVVRVGGFVVILVIGVAAISAGVAVPIVDARVGVVAKRLDEHTAKQEGSDAFLKAWLERAERRDRRAQAKLDALCRATPKAQCPLGEEAAP